MADDIKMTQEELLTKLYVDRLNNGSNNNNKLVSSIETLVDQIKLMIVDERLGLDHQLEDSLKVKDQLEHQLQYPRDSNDDSQLLKDCFDALGWMGGTRHQVIEVLRQCKRIQEQESLGGTYNLPITIGVNSLSVLDEVDKLIKLLR
jgi:hypothetical protein